VGRHGAASLGRGSKPGNSTWNLLDCLDEELAEFGELDDLELLLLELLRGVDAILRMLLSVPILSKISSRFFML
jgi:hypothetical protein